MLQEIEIFQQQVISASALVGTDHSGLIFRYGDYLGIK